MPRSAAGTRLTVRDFGTCLYFAGTGMQVSVNDIASKLNLQSATPSSFTLAAWFRTAGGQNDVAGISLMGSSCRLGLRSTQLPFFQLKAGSTIFQGTVPLLPSAWYHLAAVYDSVANTAALYVNGASVTSGTPADKDLSAVSRAFQIGVTGGNYKGHIDEVVVTSSAASAADMVALYAQGTLPANVVSYHKLDEGSGTTIADSSGNGFSGTFSGSPLWSTDVVMKPRVTAPVRGLAQPYAATILGTPNLIGYWKLNEASGTTATDSSGAGHNGTSEANVVQGKPGIIGTDTAYQFQHTGSPPNSRISIPGVALDTTAGHFNTVDLWVLWDGTDGCMVHGIASTYTLYFFSGFFGFNTGAGDVYGVSSAGFKNRWRHVAAVFINGAYTGNNLLYIDGQQVACTQVVGSAGSGTAATTQTIGGWSAGTTTEHSGRIAHVAAYSRALSASEIQQHFLSAQGAARIAVV